MKNQSNDLSLIRSATVQPRFWASRASPAQKWPGLWVILFQKLFKGYIFCFLGVPIGRYVFEQFAHETNGQTDDFST